MQNDIISNNFISDSVDNAFFSTELMAFDDYYYSTVISKQNTIIDNQNKTIDLINEGFSFLSFVFVFYFLYIFIKNLIRR